MAEKKDTPKKTRSRGKSAQIWHLVTNHQNMLYILAAGMVMSPAGFRGKHYSDSLSDFPGWIPLFRDGVKIPADVLNHVTSERKHLLPCIASLDLSGFPIRVRKLSRDGKMREVTSPPSKKSKDDFAILIHAPLPPTLIWSINFCTPEDKQAFENAANEVSNVELSTLQVEVAESLFSGDTEVAWPAAQPQTQLFEDSIDNFPAFGQALGGVLAMLHHTANRSDLGLATFRLATGAARGKDCELFQSDPILAELPKWIDQRKISEQAVLPARLFWGVIQSLIDVQMQDHPQTPIDVALGYLKTQLEQLRDSEFQPRLERLIADMQGCLGLGSGTINELLERHKGSLSRPLLLFCLRENCTELLEFSQSILSDTEYLLAGILFGVRDTWLRLPKKLRSPEISAYVAFKMADAEHRKIDDIITINVPPRPKPLRELFPSPFGEWISTKKKIAVDLASKCNWNDCIQTIITLEKGDFPKSFERSGWQVVFPGKVKEISEEVIEAKFLHRLGQWPPIDSQIESEIRDKLKNLQEMKEETNGIDPLCE